MLHVEFISVLCNNFEALLIESLVFGKIVEAIPSIVVSFMVVISKFIIAMQLNSGCFSFLLVFPVVNTQIFDHSHPEKRLKLWSRGIRFEVLKAKLVEELIVVSIINVEVDKLVIEECLIKLNWLNHRQLISNHCFI